MPDKVKVRLSIRPDEDTEVDHDELPVLRSQGLLIEGEAAAQPGSGDGGSSTGESGSESSTPAVSGRKPRTPAAD